MDERRANRYEEKLSMLELKRESILEHMERDKDIVLKTYEEMMDSLKHTLSMILVDMDEPIYDGMEKVRVLKRKGLLNEKDVEIYREMQELQEMLDSDNGHDRSELMKKIDELNGELDDLLSRLKNWWEGM